MKHLFITVAVLFVVVCGFNSCDDKNPEPEAISYSVKVVYDNEKDYIYVDDEVEINITSEPAEGFSLDDVSYKFDDEEQAVIEVSRTDKGFKVKGLQKGSVEVSVFYKGELVKKITITVKEKVPPIDPSKYGCIIFSAKSGSVTGVFENGLDTLMFYGEPGTLFPDEMVPAPTNLSGKWQFGGWSSISIAQKTLAYPEAGQMVIMSPTPWKYIMSFTFKAGNGTFANGQKELVVTGSETSPIKAYLKNASGAYSPIPDDETYFFKGWNKNGVWYGTGFGNGTKFSAFEEGTVFEAVYEKKPLYAAAEGDVFVKILYLTNPDTEATSNNFGIKVKKLNNKIVIFETTKELPPVENIKGWVFYEGEQVDPNKQIVIYLVENQEFFPGPEYELELGKSTLLMLEVVNNDYQSTFFNIELSIDDEDWVKL